MSTKHRNSPCPCGSGKKLKKCCLDKNHTYGSNEATPLAMQLAFASKTQAILMAETWRQMTVAAKAGDLIRLNELADTYIDVMYPDPEIFTHRLHYTAHHEAGHALVATILGLNLKNVTVSPHYESIEEFKKFVSFGAIPDGQNRILPSPTTSKLQVSAVALAGEIAALRFCQCAMHKFGDLKDLQDVQEPPGLSKQEAISILFPVVEKLIARHGPQVQAIANALVEHQTLSGDEVKAVMLASGWNPETDVDPLGLDAEAAA